YFEKLALVIATLADNNMLEDPYHTRAVRDGGRDGIGQYTIMNNLNNPLKVTYAVEAKCYSLDDGVGVKETSRLISRIRNRQFGILVTTSFVADQAYKEIIEDEQPIAIIAGIDVIDILYNKLNITNSNILLDYLITNYPKRI
ncbi:MAG: restriction endonuclease, partial [Bacilli bacterium]|nr:restriction endonuclease [Bacilli bacterium]